MQRGLIDISGEYLNTESKIIDSESKLGKAAWAGVMAGLGPIGNVIDAGKATIEGNYGKTVSKIIDLVGDVKKNTEGGHIKWRDMFGLDVVTDPLAKGIEKAKGKLTSGWEWAAAVVENGWDNYEEHGKFSSRFFEETAVESAIDIGKGALIAVGVGAAAAAVGISAPAWAIGAAGAVVAVGVDAGLNAIVRWATDNPKADWKEGASDFICDTGEKVFKETKKVVNGAVKSVKKGWNSFVNSVTSRGSSTGWGRLAFY